MRKWLSCAVLSLSLANIAFAQAHPAPLPEHIVTLSFLNTPLRDLIKFLGNLGPVNLLVSEKVNGVAEIQMRDVKWKDAFESLLFSHQLRYSSIGDVLLVHPESQKIEAPSSEQVRSHKKQVMIEARIVEADHRFAKNLGVKLSANSPAGQSSNPQYSLGSNLGSEGLNGFSAAQGAITMFSKGAAQMLNLELNALEAEGRGNIVANPRVVTANEVKAVIEQGTELPYQTSNKEGAKVQFRKANLKLEVTPTILKSQQIMLEVEISKDTVGMKTEQGYAIDTKHLKSQILVEDGGTVVIGGIYLQTEREDVVKVPLLGDIPFIGNLFKHRATIRDKTELLVFLTPSLI